MPHANARLNEYGRNLAVERCLAGQKVRDVASQLGVSRTTIYKWLARFPRYDSVGGRTSELPAVGLVGAALQGIDIDAMLAGAAACDEVTRQPDTRRNPSAMLALMWYYATGGRGGRTVPP